MNTTTPARRAGVASRTGASDLTTHRTAVTPDWECLTLLQPEDPHIDAAAAYAELGMHVIPDPALPGSSPLPSRTAVLQHWRRAPHARVGLVTGTRFDVLAIRTDERGRRSLQLLAAVSLLDDCFAQLQRQDDVLLLFAPGGLRSGPIGMAAQGVNMVGLSDHIDVTPRHATWLFVEPRAYGQPVPVNRISEALS